MMNQPTGIELFAGCGGLSTGFLDAGLRMAAGFEIDARAVDAFDYNHAYRGGRGYQADLSRISGSELLGRAGLPEVDFIVGGPPCQPFSIAGKMKGVADHRANLIDHFIRIVEELNPAACLFENVPNLASMDEGALLRRLKAQLGALGYAVGHQVLAAVNFGVPQNRKRLIVLAAKTDVIHFPAATHGFSQTPFRTVSDALNDLPDAGEFGETGIYNHEPTAHSRDMVERLSRLAVGCRERGSFHDRLHPDRPSYTLRAGTGNFSPLRPIHHKYHRVVTVRESARLQGFSDDFRWPDRIPRLQQYRQVGNAVPPPLAKAVAISLAEQMGWPLDPEGYSGNPNNREPANRLTDDERRRLRTSRMRGASLGKAVLAAE